MNGIQPHGLPDPSAVPAVRPDPGVHARDVPALAPDSGDVRPSPAQPGVPGQHAGRMWLAAATIAVALLAAAAAVVSWDAQYVMVARARHDLLIAALEAGIPDAGAAVFAALGIALARTGRRALRPRALNLACVGLSLVMNAMAAGPGLRDAAIWVMPAAVYALASDTLIAVIRAHAISRIRTAGQTFADHEATPLAAAGHLALWLLRLTAAPVSTLTGLRTWLITQTPAAPRSPVPGSLQATGPSAPHDQIPDPGTTRLTGPGVPGPRADEPAAALGRGGTSVSPVQSALPRRRSASGKTGKQDLLIALAAQRHDLRTLPLRQAAPIASGIATDIGLHPGTARRVLRAHVQALQAGAAPTSTGD